MSSEFIAYYQSLIILQYANKDKAVAEIGAIIQQFESAYDLLSIFIQAFDVDTATGDRLDKIGGIVGRSRTVENLIEKRYFGFEQNPSSLGFGEGPFFTLDSARYTAGELDDPQYRVFIKAKIAKNITSCYPFSDDRVGMVETYLTLFDEKAIPIDNKDMTMSLLIDPSYPLENLRLLAEEDLLPTPQGVGLDFYYDVPTNFFGFSNNPQSNGFGVGLFATLIDF